MSHPLLARRDFKLQAEFNRHTYWYLAWIDTKGTAQIAARSEHPEKTLEYPQRNQLVAVDPKDPPGLHLLLILASDRPPQEVEPELQQRLAAVGPPMLADGKLLSVAVSRGAGSIHPTQATLDPDYFARIESRLPGMVRWVHQLYLPAQR